MNNYIFFGVHHERKIKIGDKIFKYLYHDVLSNFVLNNCSCNSNIFGDTNVGD